MIHRLRTPDKKPEEAAVALPAGGASAWSPLPLDSAHEDTSVSTDAVDIPLALLRAHWPAALHEALSDQECARIIRFPRTALEPGLRRGRIAMRWEQVLQWASPPLELSPILKALRHTEVEVPLCLVVPLLVDHLEVGPKDAGEDEKARVVVPDLFTPETPEPTPASPISPRASAGSPPPAATTPVTPVPTAPLSTPVPAGIPKGSARTEWTAPANAPEPTLEIPVSLLLTRWPSQVQLALSPYVSALHVVALPVGALDPMLKRGERLSFPLSQLRDWIRPELSAAIEPGDRDPVLEIPMPLLARAYLQWCSQPPAAKNSPTQAPVNPAATTSAPRPAGNIDPAGASLASSEAAPGSRGSARRRLVPTDWLSRLRRVPALAGMLLVDEERGLVAAEVPPAWHAECLAEQFARLYRQAEELRATMEVSTPPHLWLWFEGLATGLWRVEGYYIVLFLREATPAATESAQKAVEGLAQDSAGLPVAQPRPPSARR